MIIFYILLTLDTILNHFIFFIVHLKFQSRAEEAENAISLLSEKFIQIEKEKETAKVTTFLP